MPRAKPKTVRKTEAHTAAPLKPSAPIAKSDARARVLDALLALALEGNVAAAKLYLDWTRDNAAAPDGVTLDDAIRLLREMEAPRE